MNEMIEVLIKRDGMNRGEAEQAVTDFRAEVEDAINRGAGICEIEDMILSDFGLEPDYLDDIIFSLV